VKEYHAKNNINDMTGFKISFFLILFKLIGKGLSIKRKEKLDIKKNRTVKSIIKLNPHPLINPEKRNDT
jgi:hypothetical protein